MSWRQVDRVLGDWGDPEVEARERKLLSQSEAEARFLRKREREQEVGAGGEAEAASKRIQEGVGVWAPAPHLLSHVLMECPYPPNATSQGFCPSVGGPPGSSPLAIL
jgi:hypothetical protein